MPSGNRATAGLIRGLGLWSAIAVIVGSMIGQAVFLVASDMARELDSPTRVIAVWMVGGIIVLFGAFCYAELGAAMPEAGGDYVYLSRGLGPVWGFLYGWTSSMIMRPCIVAAVNLWLVRPVRSSVGLAIILLGVPFFCHWRKPVNHLKPWQHLDSHLSPPI
jgi:APA family basic amino acid/polyamine antiporter